MAVIYGTAGLDTKDNDLKPVYPWDYPDNTPPETWMERRVAKYFLKCGAEGVVDGRRVRWDPATLTLTDIDAGTVVHDLRDAFAEMDQTIRDSLLRALRSVARSQALGSF